MKRLTTALIMTLLSCGTWAAEQPQAATTPSASPTPAALSRFNVEVQDAPARAFFRGLVDGTPQNILVHPEVSGRVSLSLKNVTVEEVLEAVRDMYGYDYRKVAAGYFVLPATLQTRIFRLNYLDLQRIGTSKTRVTSGQISDGDTTESGGAGERGATGSANDSAGDRSREQNGVSGTAVLTRNASDFWTGIEADIRAMVGEGANRSVVINRQSGVIVVRALPNELRDIGDYIQKTEQTVTRQVVLEAKIVEVELSDAYQAGINWAAVLRDGGRQYFIGQSAPRGGFDANAFTPAGAPVTVAPGNPIGGFVQETLGGAFTLAANFADFNAFIELLGLQGRTRVLSSPRVSTLHNQKAVIKAGSDEFFVTDIRTDTVTGTASSTTVDLELTPFFSGVALDVTPQIGEDGTVLLHVHPSVSDVTDQQKSLTVRGTTDVLPLAFSQVRESDSIVKARSGQVIVIGGLMRETRRRQQHKTPGLGDVPVVGRAFRSERNQSTTTELVILLRPLVVTDNDWPTLVAEPTQRISELEERGRLNKKKKEKKVR